MTGYRLKSGGAIDRAGPVAFSFDGTRLQGFAGDTLASALLANGRPLVARSFKYHRPRGIMSAGLEEASALVTIGSGAHATPNTLATTEELIDGLEAHSQHCWPSLRFDLGAINQLFAKLFSAGFYYKTFMGPGKSPRSWLFYEHFIRRAAGLGEASRAPDPDRYESREAFCDLLVIGAGPAGLEAARVAAEAGLDVILAERDFRLGGALLHERDGLDGETTEAWLAQRERQLGAPNVRILRRTSVFGLYDNGAAGMVERLVPGAGVRERFWVVRAKRIVIAAGAMERPLIFGGNDRPGVMLASAMRAYANRWAVATGGSAVIASNNDSAYAAACDLARVGISTILLDARDTVSDRLRERSKISGVDLRLGRGPLRVIGRHGVRGVEIGGTDGGNTEVLSCNALGMSGGWSPTQHLLSQRGVKPVWNDSLAAFLPGEAREPVRCAGAAAGHWRAEDCAQSGRAAGAEAARALGRAAPPAEDFPAAGGWETPIRAWSLGAVKGKAFVDLQNDVTLDDVRQACAEGYDAPELLKRYTTLGMATDQGRTSAVNALAVIAEARGRPLPEVGTTTFRPPFAPVSIGALAGVERDHHLQPTRRSPMHDALVAQGARMLETGLWLRPWFYPQGAEDVDQAYLREMRLVREAVGICDVSTLGKIAVQGPDAGELLDRVYVNAFKSLPVGKARYGVMLRDDGIVMDDGTSWRLGEHEYFMTTTTANAGKVMAWLEELLETRWPELRVAVTSVTDQWAGASVAGPQARALLQAMLSDVDMANDAFPFMGVREGRFDGVPCRIARISFSGELAYEVYVPADHGAALWRALLEGAKARGGDAYGLETLGALRVEKGHVGGPELDGRATLDDLGLGKMASTRKPFIGSVLRKRSDLQRKDRPQLVGLVPTTHGETFKGGSILCEAGNDSGHGLGWVTSVTESPSLGHWVGLGLLRGGLEAWQGRELIAADPIRGRSTRIKVVAPHFLDPEGARLHA